LLAATQMNTPDGNATYDDYDNKICELRATLETCGYRDGTTAWMRELIKQWFGFPEPRDWQAECCSNLTQKRDVFLTAPTGSGKSITIFAPIIANRVLKRPHLGIAIYPIGRGGSKAWCSHVGNLKYDLYAFSPEMLVHDRFNKWVTTKKVMKNLAFFVFDEAHMILTWGKTFRPSYDRLSAMRARLGSAVTWSIPR